MNSLRGTFRGGSPHVYWEPVHGTEGMASVVHIRLSEAGEFTQLHGAIGVSLLRRLEGRMKGDNYEVTEV